jgi:hypothetical protein
MSFVWLRPVPVPFPPAFWQKKTSFVSGTLQRDKTDGFWLVG